VRDRFMDVFGTKRLCATAIQNVFFADLMKKKPLMRSGRKI